jgi:signal transduction histidine kinase
MAGTEQERAAALEERMRIARELHDIVTHDVSEMLILAQAARSTMEADPERARAAMAAVEDAGREAVDELRRLLRVLRPDADEPAGAEVTPQPSLERVGALLGRAREAGLEVDLRVEGEPGSLAPGLDLTAFRLVEEALDGAVDHGDPGYARVTLRWSAERLEIEVASSVDAGRRLPGMRERAAVCGGELRAGPVGRGFVVRARLPRDPALSRPGPEAA